MPDFDRKDHRYRGVPIWIYGPVKLSQPKDGQKTLFYAEWPSPESYFEDPEKYGKPINWHNHITTYVVEGPNTREHILEVAKRQIDESIKSTNFDLFGGD